jgi:hypothetical protein
MSEEEYEIRLKEWEQSQETKRLTELYGLMSRYLSMKARQETALLFAGADTTVNAHQE